jgi:hypothetical protein
MTYIATTFLTFVVEVTEYIFTILGDINAAYSNALTSAGIPPIGQLLILAFICFALTLLTFRFMHIFFGWTVSILLIMLLLYWFVPNFRPDGAPVTIAIETAV